MVKKPVTVKKTPKAERKNVSPLLLTAAAGALVGAMVAMYAPRRKPKKWGYTIADTCNRFSSKLGEINNQINEVVPPKSSKKKLVCLGAIAGGAIGLTAISLLTKGSKRKEDGHGLMNTVKEAGQAAVDGFHAIDWGEVAEQVAHTVVQKLQGGGDDDESEEDDSEEESLEKPANNIQNIVDWAILGLNVWQNIKKGRQ